MTTTQRWILGIVVLLIVIVIIAVLVARPDGGNNTFTLPEELQDGEDIPGEFSDQEPLVVTHNFENGTHRFGGSVPLPTPCYILTAEAQVAESFPEQITIVLRMGAPAPETVCTQVIDHASFDLLVTASADATLSRVTLDGARVPFEVFEESKG